jgi:hypothetical protein
VFSKQSNKILYLNFFFQRETVEFVKRQKAKAANPAAAAVANKSNATYGLEEHYEPIRKGADRDQFSVQDRVFSKWACLLQASSDGSSWHDMKDVKYCENCGEKTLICPHKITDNELVLPLPSNAKYFRLLRPKLQYNQMIVKKALDGYKKQVGQIVPNTDLYVSENTLVLTNYTPEFVLRDQNQNEECIRLLNEGDPEIGMVFFSNFITQFALKIELMTFFRNKAA